MSSSRGPYRRTALFPLVAGIVVALAATRPLAQQQQVVPGSNVNMVSGTTFPDGDPYLQRQNEPSSAVSTRNASRILGGSNDYRTVDLPGPLDPIRGEKMNADAWAGLFKSFDGGQTWKSTLLPGYPQDTSPEGLASPIHGHHAATDAVVRAGTNGMFYYAGLAFNRGDNAPSTIFVARYMDLNNLEAGDPIAYLDTRVVDRDTGVRFLDKTAVATDVPRTSARCTFVVTVPGADPEPQNIPAGNVYVAYTAFTGSGATLQSVIMFKRSTDCGATWSPALNLSIGSRLVQNAQIAISPSNGHVYVSYRRFRSGSQDDAIMVVKSTNGGVTFGKPVRVAGIAPFDQGSTETSFRSNGFQTMAVDTTGRAYLAWTERGYSTLRPDAITGDARIVISTSATGALWTVPRPVSGATDGHQLMPALTFHAGKLRLLYYDLHEDVSGRFDPFVDELPIITGPEPRVRHTIDVFVAQALPGAAPVFTSTRLSDYAFGYTPGDVQPVRLQFNPPNLPLFRMGTTPFMGDYIDLAPSPAFVQNAAGVWVHNTAPTTNAMSHAFWTDNRDVRPPADGDWSNYSPVNSSAILENRKSRFDPTQFLEPCVAGNEGMRNQNIYTARVSDGLFLTAPANNKPLGAMTRAFVVVAENATEVIRSFRLTIDPTAPGTNASFLQFGPLQTLDLTLSPFSSAARTVFVTSGVETAQVSVSIAEIVAPGGGTVAGGLAGSVVLNPDPTSPRIQNPRIQNPRIQNPIISVAEAYNPAITNGVLAAPRIQNPRIQNPSILNPRIQNPRIQNDGVATPRIQNDSVANPSVVLVGTQSSTAENAGIANPRIQNPRIQNVDLTNAGFSDTSWEITNDGNTTAAYTVNLVLNGTVPAGFATQLLLHKTVFTPAARNCELAEQPHTILLANVPDPEFVPPTDVANPRIQNPRIQNPTLALAPGETATITLRTVDPNRFDGITFDASAAVTPATVAQAVNTQDVAAGILTPRVALPLTITTADLDAAAPGTPYSRTLTAFGTTGPVTWMVQEGAVPPGMTLSPGGTISGTPTAPGNYVFTVRSTDAAGNVDDQRLFIQVNPTVPPGFDSVWNGQDTDWSNPMNWSPRGVPLAEDRVYIPASVTPGPALTRDVTVRDLLVEPGATLNTNGFTLTVTGNVDAGRTITGAGRTIVTGDGAVIAGVFADLEIRGRATLSSAVTTTGRLILTAGARLLLNGQSLSIGGPLTTDVAAGAVPVIVGPSSALVSTGIDVNGLLIRNAALLVQNGTLTRFDNVTFDGFQAEQRQLTLRHPGQIAPFEARGVAFFLVGDPGAYVRVEDTDNATPQLVVNFINAIPADGEDNTLAIGAVVNWIFDQDGLNLGVFQHVSPVPALAGSRLTYTIIVTNGSPFHVTDVVLNPGVPTAAQAVNIETADGVCDSNLGSWTCQLPLVAQGNQALVTVSYIWPTAGLLTTTATVSTATNAVDVWPANNSHTVVATLIGAAAAANVSIVKRASSAFAAVGMPFNYELTVTNDGPALATNVVVTDILPAGLSIGTIATSQGSCLLVATNATCSLGSIEPGQSATITIPVTPSAPGLLVNIAAVVSDGIELSPENNIAAVTLLVAVDVGCGATFAGPMTYAASAGASTLVFLADMNHDGAPDIVTGHHTTAGSGAAVLLNDGTGSFGFRLPATSTNATVLPSAVADFNGDTHPDVLLLEFIEQGSRLRLLLGNGTGTLTPQPVFAVVSPTAFFAIGADLDGDGDQDVLTRGTAGDLVVFRNNGSGVFGAPVSLLATSPTDDSPVVRDLNGDSRPDIAIAGPGAAFTVLLANATGSYEAPVAFPTASVPRIRAVADVNADGFLDVALTEGSSSQGTARLTLRFGDGAGAFGPEVEVLTGNTVQSPTFADVNGDGQVDLITTHPPRNTVAVQLGNGSGGFAAPVHFSTPAFSNPAVADLNDDGRPDIVVGDVSGTLRVLLNACGQPPIDLGLTLVESADPVAEGAELIYTVTLTNHGASPATNITLTSVISNGLNTVTLPNVSVEATSSGGGTLTSSGGVFTWTLPTVAAHGVVSFEFRVTPHAARNLSFTSTVTSSGQDTNASNNTVSETTTVTAIGAELVVSNTNDSGPGSLRQAILNSNADAGDVDRIVFAIAGTGPHTIVPLSAMPTITQPVVIDGTTQPGFSDMPVIELRGSGLLGNGLSITGGSTTVRGLAVNSFGGTGIFMSTNGGNRIVGNYVGTDVTGTIARPNGNAGVQVLGAASSNNVIGGTTPADRNVISGGGINGVSLRQGTTGNIISGNYIGTNASGTAALGNGAVGVFIGESSNNVVGGTAPGAGNVISGNVTLGVGIFVQAAPNMATGNLIQGNLIGINATGTAAVPNGSNGVGIGQNAAGNTVGGTTVAARNIISGNAQSGIGVTGGGSNNVVQGNYIGLGTDGATPIPNLSNGIFVDAPSTIVGGGSAGARNVIASNGSAGVAFSPGASGSAVRANFIGTDATGMVARPNNVGIGVHASGIVIGGSATGEGNLISGNTGSGIGLWAPNTQFSLPAANSNHVLGNLIGTNAQGTAALPNSEDGIYIGGANNTIGGTTAGARNVISGNATGVNIASSADSNGNVVQGNYIGTDITGTAALPNLGVGIGVHGANNTIGGSASGAGNVISGNSQTGIGLWNVNPAFALPPATNTTVAGNLIGTNASGTAAIGNGREGIWIDGSNNLVGGTTPGERNVISGNGTGATTHDGVGIGGGSSANIVRGNYIGTNAAGTAALGNGSHGVFIHGGTGHTVGGTDAGAGNLISGNVAVGIGMYNGASQVVVQGNLIGTNATGTASIANGAGINIHSSHNNTIGGLPAGAGNLISGNTGGNGIWIFGSNSNTVQGNRIGTNAAGSAAIPNGYGMFVMGESNIIGGTTAGAGNVISGNTNLGISVATGSTSTVLKGNRIGTNAAGTGALPNGSHGVFLDGSTTTVGGTDAGAANVIAHNGLAGVFVNTGTGHAILGNSIRDNGDIGIDIQPFGPTANDAGDTDSGANELQNFPVLVSAVTSGATTTLQGTLNSTANTTFRLEFFANTGCDRSGRGEGQTFAGFADVTTDGAGNATFSRTVSGGGIFTATATDPSGNTSEFSTCLTATIAPAAVARVFVVHPGAFSAPASVSIIDPSTNAVTNVVTVGANAQDVALSPDGARLYVTNSGSNGVSVIDVATNQIIGTAAASVSAMGIRLKPDGTRAYVTGSGSVFVVDTATLGVIATIPVGSTPAGLDITPDGSHVYVANRGTDNVSVISTATNTVVATVVVGDLPTRVAMTPDGSRAYVSNFQSNSVSVIDATTNTVIATVAVGTGPNGIGVTPDGTQVYVANFHSNTISRIDVATNTVLGSIAFAGNPEQIDMLGSNRAYVGAFNGSAVRVIDTTTNTILASIPTASPFPIGIAAGTAQVAAGSADLAVVLSDAPDPTTFNSLVTFTASITNNGPDAASHVTLTTQLPTGFVFVSATAGSCSASGTTVTCLIGILASGAAASVELVVRVNAVGALTTTARVHAAQGDPQIGNNLASTSTTVNPAAMTFTVTNTLDSGAGSLREAITLANANAGGIDIISFDIPGGGPHSIALTAALPTITDPVIIDGTTQAGFDGAPIVELNGTSAGANTNGLQITAGSSAVRGLVINRFTRAGVALSGPGGNVIQGNYIGLSSSGTTAASNGPFGIEVFGSQSNLIGGLASGDGNVIAAATSINISLQGGAHNNTIVGNLIGLNAAGTAPVGAQQNGVYLIGSNGNQIGGTAAGARNVIAGHNGTGQVVISGGSTGTVVQGNYIGTNAAGSAGFAGSTWGIQLTNAVNSTVGGSLPGAGNVISGNGPGGIVFFGTSTNNTLSGNLIGTAADGATPLPNGGYGVGLLVSTATNNRIGGLTAAARNVVAFNTGPGVALSAGQRNQVLGNHIHSNGGLGIDLGVAGVTPNDVGDIDTGPNELQNFPVLTSAVSGDGTTALAGTLSGSGNTEYRIEFFANTACDPSGHGEGQIFAGFVNVISNAVGNATFDTTVPGSGIFTATATDPTGNTSEFSPCITPAPGPTTFTVTNTNDSGPGSLRQAILDANARTNTTDTISFNLSGSAPFTIAPETELPAIVDGVIIDGFSQPGSNTRPVVELTGINAPGTARGLWIFSGNSTVRGLTINNFSTGIHLDTGPNNRIEGSHIGTDWTGSSARPNTVGILVQSSNSNVIGGATATPATRNVIAGNRNASIDLGGSLNVVQGNYIGLNVTGTTAILAPDSAPNGILLRGSNNTIGGATAAARNVISGFSAGAGIFITIPANNNSVSGNYIGTTADGLSAVTNSFAVLAAGTANRIGVALPGGGNLISGNTTGIRLSNTAGPGNTVVNNVLGLNTLGATLANSLAIETSGPTTIIGGTAAFTRNFIAGNVTGARVMFGADFTRVEGNTFGFGPAGEVRPNGLAIELNSVSSVTIGGLAEGAGNIIANSATAGVQVLFGTNNAIRRNSIHSNGGLGIDLTPVTGVTPNDPLDADAGTNNFQNFPTLTSVVVEGGTTTVTGALHSTPNSTFVVDFFTSTSCHASGNGEGETWWGSTNLATDASGNAPISVMVPVALSPGIRLTATALDVTGGAQNSSEFSNCISVPLEPAAPVTLGEFFARETVETYPPNFGRQNSAVSRRQGRRVEPALRRASSTSGSFFASARRAMNVS